MPDTRPVIVDVFASAGLAAHEAGVLPDALAELAVRLDIAGAGDLLAELCGLQFTAPLGGGKRDPQPRPTPKPPPQPKPPKNCDCAQCVSNRRYG